ncbi:MAG TPA: DUF4302 domain-containing protein [Flavobacterium sp.]|jgi:hypothetical protein
MKLKIITNYIVVAFLALQLISCDRKEDADPLFDAPAAERVTARAKELDAALKASPEGWKAVYFTDKTQLGGFTHLFKFQDGGNVVMASDFNDASITRDTSRYSIDLRTTVSLVFTTKNRIHLLSESDNFPTAALRGKGYKGDFQFLYYGQENGQLIFRTNRSFEELRFVKATAEEWTNLLAANRLMIPNVIGIPSPTRPRSMFRILETNDGTTILKYNFDFAPQLTRFATYTSGSNEIKNMGIAYTPTGITVSPAVEVGGQKLTDFIYDNDTGNFTAIGTNGVSASIKYSVIPAPTDDYKDLLPGKPFTDFGYRSELFTAASNSPLFRSLEQQVNMTSGRTIRSIDFTFNDNNYSGTSYIQYVLSGGFVIRNTVNVVEDPVNKKIKLESIKWNREFANPGGTTLPNVLGPDIARPAYLANLDNQLITPAGLYVKKESFRIVYGNTIYTFSNANGFRITTYKY